MCALLSGLYIGGDHEGGWGRGAGLAKEGKKCVFKVHLIQLRSSVNTALVMLLTPFMTYKAFHFKVGLLHLISVFRFC